MTPRQWLLAGVVVILGVAAFLLFRPDTLVTEVETTEALDEAFASSTSAAEPTTTASSVVADSLEEEVTVTTPACGGADPGCLRPVYRDRPLRDGHCRDLRTEWEVCP